MAKIHGHNDIVALLKAHDKYVSLFVISVPYSYTILYSQDPGMEAVLQELHDKNLLNQADKISVPQDKEKNEPTQDKVK